MSDALHDRYHRVVNYLRISVTDRCNLRCTYCMPEAGIEPVPHAQILTYEELLRVARLAVSLGIRKVRVTGGEPLVRRGILGFIEALSQLPGVADLSLTTNGLLLEAQAARLRAAGLQRVNVSLDTLRPEVFERITRRPGLERVLHGLAEARRVGLDPVKVNVVAMRGVNDGEILAFAALAEQSGYEVRFIEFMPAEPNAWDRGRFLSAADILAVLRSRYDLVPVRVDRSGSGPGRAYTLPGGARIAVISPMSDHFCGTCNRLRLTAEGRLRSCLFASDEMDLRAALRVGGSDEELARMIRASVLRKPEGHSLADTPDSGGCGLTMSRIGG